MNVVDMTPTDAYGFRGRFFRWRMEVHRWREETGVGEKATVARSIFEVEQNPVPSEQTFVKCQKHAGKKKTSSDVKREFISIRFSPTLAPFYCLLFAEPPVAEGLDNCRLLGKIRFHVAIGLPSPSSISSPNALR